MTLFQKINKEIELRLKKTRAVVQNLLLKKSEILMICILFLSLFQLGLSFLDHSKRLKVQQNQAIRLNSLEKRYQILENKHKETQRVTFKHKNSNEEYFHAISQIVPLEKAAHQIETHMQNPHLPKPDSLKIKLEKAKKPISFREEPLAKIGAFKQSLFLLEEKTQFEVNALEKLISLVEKTPDQAPQLFFTDFKIEVSKDDPNQLFVNCQILKREYP